MTNPTRADVLALLSAVDKCAAECMHQTASPAAMKNMTAAFVLLKERVEAITRRTLTSEASIIADAATKEMDKAVQCLYIAVTESVARDVDARWQAVKAAIRKLGEGHASKPK